MACCIDKQNSTVSEFVESSWWKNSVLLLNDFQGEKRFFVGIWFLSLFRKKIVSIKGKAGEVNLTKQPKLRLIKVVKSLHCNIEVNIHLTQHSLWDKVGTFQINSISKE